MAFGMYFDFPGGEIVLPLFQKEKTIIRAKNFVRYKKFN